jgi:hypothetical protein
MEGRLDSVWSPVIVGKTVVDLARTRKLRGCLALDLLFHEISGGHGKLSPSIRHGRKIAAWLYSGNENDIYMSE